MTNVQGPMTKEAPSTNPHQLELEYPLDFGRWAVVVIAAIGVRTVKVQATIVRSRFLHYKPRQCAYWR